MIFLSALGSDAHDWERFAPKGTNRYHAYAITRRGFGTSDEPAPTDENYSADRLADDVLAVMGTLKLERPVLVGWFWVAKNSVPWEVVPRERSARPPLLTWTDGEKVEGDP
jgi:pimeloyl-ACP methyl ester carboxylesterase